MQSCIGSEAQNFTLTGNKYKDIVLSGHINKLEGSCKHNQLEKFGMPNL